MSAPQEFQYRIPRRVSGWRPGSHPGLALGAGQEFVTHMSLFDRPDPRRLDLRASVRSLRHEWLVRVNRQRAGVAVHVVMDVSASMSFGASRPKLDAAADFVEALGQSAFRVGDALGLLAFDAHERRDLHVPALLSRGAGSVMAAMLRDCAAGAAGAEGIAEALLPLAGREGLVFLCSDFHWPLQMAAPALDLLSHAYVVPMVFWDPAEIAPPESLGLARVRDVESGATRTLWLRPKIRERWRERVAERRAELREFFGARGMRPFFVEGAFDGEALSQYFFEAAA